MINENTFKGFKTKNFLSEQDFDLQALRSIKMLALEMIDKAQSGHPGIVMSAAPLLYVLFKKHLAYDLEDRK
jgi:transketolase